MKLSRQPVGLRSRAFAAWLVLVISLIVFPPQAWAHPAPFSYIDLHLEADRIDGTLTVHTIDLAHELQLDEPAMLLDQRVLAAQYGGITGLLGARLQLGEARAGQVRWGAITPLPGDAAVRIAFTQAGAPPPAFALDAHLFDYDPAHQTFVNVYEGGALAQQWILTSGDSRRTHYAGTAAGAWEVLKTFVPSGVHHILIGPDHVLFIVGLILLGGTWRRLALIVTAFTIGHSVTLSLAATGLVMVPAAIVEPLIALSIVVVGLDNLLRLRGDDEGRDLRGWLAGLFGLIHGFGFAYVLREFGLPQGQLALSLLGFNLGVEVGQLAIVLVVALALGAVRRRRPQAARQIATIGSLAVAAAGAYWFVDRVFLAGVGS